MMEIRKKAWKKMKLSLFSLRFFVSKYLFALDVMQGLKCGWKKKSRPTSCWPIFTIFFHQNKGQLH